MSTSRNIRLGLLSLLASVGMHALADRRHKNAGREVDLRQFPWRGG